MKTAFITRDSAVRTPAPPATRPDDAGTTVRLRVLGATDLRDQTGRELRALVAQPKRLGLLALLASADPHRPFWRKDTILAMLWPDFSQRRARAALRASVYQLRRVLGSGIVMARGTEEIGLEWTRVEADVAQFRIACRTKDWEPVLELYRGPFLDGFYLSDAPEFERWIDRQRAYFKSEAVSAAWALVGRYEQSEPQLALRLARQALVLEPDDELGVRRLLSLQDRLGDRAGAWHVFNDLHRRMRDDLGIDPSPETVALMAAIRSRS
jgi:serine/threonine-protein kinase